MIYVVIDLLRSRLIAADLFGYFRVFTYVEFRAIAAILVSFATVLILAPRTIRWLIRQKIGDRSESFHKALNELTRNKQNTPTMGGILIVAAILVSILLLSDVTEFYVQMAVVCLLWSAAVGFADDWLKLKASQRPEGGRQGLHMWEKLVFQFGLGFVLSFFIFRWGSQKLTRDYENVLPMAQSLNLPLMRSWEWVDGQLVPASDLIVLGAVAFTALSTFVIVTASNAVNLTDGMDGLASGIAAICGFALAVLAFISGFEREGQTLAKTLLVPFIPRADELAIVAGAMVGACIGFLWFNCSPAQVFMGDTGSLSLGALLGYIAVVIRQEVLLLIVGGIFAAEAISVILQIGYFKLTGGKRIFRCAPLHYHFHLGGWTEQQVVVRFWAVTAMLAAAALALVKVR